MVTFSCSGCGETMKKAKVEHHLHACRNCDYVTCIDCSKDFHDDKYKNHTSCISENQKYGAAGEVHKQNKGDVKQQEWIKSVRSAAEDENISPKLTKILKQLEAYENIPRKKGKFVNFLGNSLKIYNTKFAEEVYDAVPQPKNEIILQQHNGNKHTVEKDTKSDNNITKTNLTETAVKKELTAEGKAFSWNKAIKRVLNDAPDNELPIKKLRKKVFKEYKKSVLKASRVEKPALKEKFATRVESCKKFTTVGDVVQLTKK